MSTRTRVPSLEHMKAMADYDLRELRRQLRTAVSDCESAMTSADPARRFSINAALRHYASGLQAINRIFADREGVESYRKVRDVTDPASAIKATKAINRLIGLLNEEHPAVSRLLDAETSDGDLDACWNVVEDIHRRVEEAIR